MSHVYWMHATTHRVCQPISCACPLAICPQKYVREQLKLRGMLAADVAGGKDAGKGQLPRIEWTLEALQMLAERNHMKLWQKKEAQLVSLVVPSGCNCRQLSTM